VERAFSFDIPVDSSLVNNGPRANSAINFCHGVTYIVRVVPPRRSSETPRMMPETRKT
jgi:hypothetical protein